MKIFQRIRAAWTAVIVGLFLLWAHWAVVSYRAAEEPKDKKVIRIGHWQLEPGVQNALNYAAAEYEKLHPDVRIVQDRIPESTYGQWVTCQLMGGTAPDILEIGIGLPNHVWLAFAQRYLLPITSYVEKPNPYNRGTSLESVPWRQTFVDGMVGGYQQELQEFLRVPLSVHGFRILYNADLLKRLTGLSSPPGTFTEWIALCQRISKMSDARGQRYVAVAGSAYHFGFWDQMLFSPALAGLTGYADFNRDGILGIDELGLAIGTGRVDLTGDTFQSYLKMMRMVTDQFQRGFNGLTRDEAVFLFSQQRAVFLLAGSFDLGGVLEVAKGRFEVGVMDFPFPRKPDINLPGVLPGPRHEAAGGQFPFSITRTSKHPEIALDFLQFLTGVEMNGKLNELIGWIPAIREAPIAPSLQAYQPSGEGLYGVPSGLANFGISGDSLIRWRQLLALYQVGQIERLDLAKTYQEYLEGELAKLRPDRIANARRERVKRQRNAVYLRALALLSGTDPNSEDWVRYRAGGVNRNVLEELYGQLIMGVEAGVFERGTNPYGPLESGGPAAPIWPFFKSDAKP